MSNDITKWGAFRIRKSSPEFVKRTRKYLNQIYYWRRGRCLLDKILSMAKVGGCVGWKLCYIQFLPNDSKFDFLGHSNPRIRYDPAYLTSLANDDLFEPTKQKVVATKKEYVYLFHELVHVYHALKGDYEGTPFSVRPAEEFRAVGLYEFENERYSENAFRYDLKLPRRPCYYWKEGTVRYEVEAKHRAKRNLPPQRQYKSEDETFKKAPPPAPSVGPVSAREDMRIGLEGGICSRAARRSPGPLQTGEEMTVPTPSCRGPTGLA